MKSEITRWPAHYEEILAYTRELGFTMPSDESIGSLLRTLVSSKQAARVLDLGTGTGLSLCWIVDGMDDQSYVTSIEMEPNLIQIAKRCFEHDQRVEIICGDAARWLTDQAKKGQAFDLIFADTWPGKYSLLDSTLKMLRPGGFYIIDDMAPQSNWPEGHDKKVAALVHTLDQRKDLSITKLDWSTGIIIGVKKG